MALAATWRSAAEGGFLSSVSIITPHCRYYQEGETLDFQGVENEWPMFYLFMIIDGAFKNLPDQVIKIFCSR